MSTKTSEIKVSGLVVHIVRKDIKNLHLGVYPPNGRVRVAVPLSVSDEAVRLAVVGKLAWIKKRRATFLSQARQSEREMVSGESHYFLGRRYRLRVVIVDGPARIILRNRTTLELQVRRDIDAKGRERILHRWYRNQLRDLVPPLLDKWEKILEVKPATWGIKKMKTKWGACNPDNHRIWLNLELIKKPIQCIEYLIVHELVHLITRHHDTSFTMILDKHLPQWRLQRDELNAQPLAHDTWSY